MSQRRLTRLAFPDRDIKTRLIDSQADASAAAGGAPATTSTGRGGAGNIRPRSTSRGLVERLFSHHQHAPEQHAPTAAAEREREQSQERGRTKEPLEGGPGMQARFVQ